MATGPPAGTRSTGPRWLDVREVLEQCLELLVRGDRRQVGVEVDVVPVAVAVRVELHRDSVPGRLVLEVGGERLEVAPRVSPPCRADDAGQHRGSSLRQLPGVRQINGPRQAQEAVDVAGGFDAAERLLDPMAEGLDCLLIFFDVGQDRLELPQGGDPVAGVDNDAWRPG
jgi:hypothetical protein